ncbi:MAG: hypothetical protein CMJ83_17865 [Planctomycetes bacterium]|nr:hypothetical protein [Planctomycetota bacterium]
MEIIGLLEAAPDAVVIVDEGGTIVDINTVTAVLFGYAREDLIGQAVEVLIPHRFRDAHPSQVQAFNRDPVLRPMAPELKLFGLCKDGREIPVEISLSPIHHRTGLLVVAAIRDVSDRRAIEAELRAARDHLESQVAERTERLAHSNEELLHEHERTRQVLDVAGVMMVSIGADERVQLINPAGAEILDLPAHEIVGQNWFDRFLPERVRVEARAVFRDLLAGGARPTHRHENPVLGRGGVERLITWHDTVLTENGAAVATLSSGADITEQRKAERALNEQASLAQLGKMAAVMAHEIKNPLAAVTGALDVVRDELPDGGTQHRILGDVIDRLHGLAATVKDLLDFARPFSSEPVPVPVRTLIEGTVKLFEQDPEFADVEVAVASSNECVVLGDVQQLNRLLYNILLNAAQAMDGRGRVEISVSREGDGCSIEVRDHGPGIREDDIDRLFEPFFTTKIHGTGLGLPTSRRIVESHGGRLQIASPSGGGTRVRMWLPRDGGESSTT